MHKARYVETDDYLAALSRMVRSAGQRAGEADPEQLVKLIEIRRDVDVAIQAAVDGLRSSGATWQWIGEATGTTRQAAIMKWGKARRSRSA